MKYLLKIVYIPAILWMAIIFGFSGDDGDKSSSLSMVITERVVDFLDIKEEKSVERLHTPIRKLAHMSEYAVLFILIYLAVFLDVRGKYQRKNLGCLSIILCAFYAWQNEICYYP